MATQGSRQAVRVRVRAEYYDELGVFAQRAQALTNASGTAIALNEGNAAEMICRARAGSSAPEVGSTLPVEETFTGLCIQSGKELRCDDAETDTRVDQAAIRALGIRSMVAVPINEEDRVVGVLAVFASTAHAFSVTHVVVLKTVANQIADYLHRTLGDEVYSRAPLPAPGEKAIAVSAAASPVPPPAVVITPAEPALAQGRLPVVPKVEPVRPTTIAGEMDPARLSQGKETNSHDEQKKSKTDFRRVFGTLVAAAALKNRPGADVLRIGAAAVVVIAVTVGLSLKLRRPAIAPQPAPEALSSPGTPAVPALASANVQPPAKNISPAPPAEQHEAQPQPQPEEAKPKREKTVVLPVSPSRISLPQPANSARAGDPSGAKDNSAPTSDALAISLGNVPASGSLSDLVSAAPAPRPRFLPPSELEPVTVIKKVPPVYPPVAKQRRLSGSVVVQGTVNKNGRISDLQVISGPPLFRDAAFAAVKQWVFRPARLNGQAIEQSTTIRVDFGVQ